MRKIITMIIITLVLVFASFFGAEAKGTVRTEARKSAMDFTSVEVSRFVNLIIENRSDGNIILRADSDIMPFLELSVEKGVFTACVSKNYKNKDLKDKVIEVYIPYNSRIESIYCDGTSTVKSQVRIKAPKLRVECLGVSKIKADFDAESIDIQCSGVSSIASDISAKKLKLECSGCSKAFLTGSVGTCEMEASGVSELCAEEFNAKELTLEVSGCSKARAFAEKADVEASGSSKIHINCIEELKAHTEGMSEIKYSGTCTVTTRGISRESSIKKEN